MDNVKTYCNITKGEVPPEIGLGPYSIYKSLINYHPQWDRGGCVGEGGIDTPYSIKNNSKMLTLIKNRGRVRSPKDFYFFEKFFNERSECYHPPYWPAPFIKVKQEQSGVQSSLASLGEVFFPQEVKCG
jgi:hypothetical protein